MRWALSWALYWLGDLVWRASERLGADRDEPPAAFRVAFVTYQRLMLWAHLVQGDGPGPWISADKSSASPRRAPPYRDVSG